MNSNEQIFIPFLDIALTFSSFDWDDPPPFESHQPAQDVIIPHPLTIDRFGTFQDVTEYLNMSLEDAARQLETSPDILEKRFKIAVRAERSWPYAEVQQLDRELIDLLGSIPSHEDGKVFTVKEEESLSHLLEKRNNLLTPCVVYLHNSTTSLPPVNASWNPILLDDGRIDICNLLVLPLEEAASKLEISGDVLKTLFNEATNGQREWPFHQIHEIDIHLMTLLHNIIPGESSLSDPLIEQLVAQRNQLTTSTIISL
jgi:hypothetical protein